MTDPHEVATSLARAILGRGVYVDARPWPYISMPEKAWRAALVKDGEQLGVYAAATRDGALRKLIESLLPEVRSTHSVASDLLERAREAGVEVRSP